VFILEIYASNNNMVSTASVKYKNLILHGLHNIRKINQALIQYKKHNARY